MFLASLTELKMSEGYRRCCMVVPALTVELRTRKELSPGIVVAGSSALRAHHRPPVPPPWTAHLSSASLASAAADDSAYPPDNA